MERSLRGRRPAWLTAPVLTVSVLSVAAGIAQFSVTAVIGDVAAHFGEPGIGDGLAAQVGLPTTTVGLAFAIVRLASLASLPISALADRHGRRRVLLTTAVVGLGLTTLAAGAPVFWVYVALVALARPAMSTVNALAGVVAAEEATARDRSASIAVVTAGYGIGSGIVSLSRGLLPGEPSFRTTTAIALVPLALLPLLARRIREPRIAAHEAVRERARMRAWPGAIPRGLRARVLVLALMTATLATATGPGFSFLFVYGERVLGASPLFLSGLVLAAAPAGLLGLLAGRLGADRAGRRVTAGVAMAIAGAAVAYGYGGGTTSLTIGYLTSIAASSAYAAPAGAMAAELVPTPVRATVAGWVTVAGVVGAALGLALVGVLGDVTGSFARPAAVVGIAVVTLSAGFALLPETKGQELV